MPSTEDIAAQQDLLQAHRQTLHVLLTQQAQFGAAYTPPAIVNGIGAARAAIAQIKQTLQSWGTPAADLPDDQGSDEAASLLGAVGLPGVPTAGGDIIMATIGAGAQGVAVGKHIQQTISATDPPESDERATLGALLTGLEQTLAVSQFDGTIQAMASFQLRLLTSELRKDPAGAVPSASTIQQVTDWLIQNVPTLAPSLNSFFRTPAVLRVLRRTDTPLDSWLEQRFGR